MTYSITPNSAPALGDIRRAGAHDWVYVSSLATARPDWPRYWEAIGVAFARGARVVMLLEKETL